MDNESKQSISEQIKISTFFVVAALSPSFLISLICVLLYLVTAFPEVKEPIQNVITNLLTRAGVKNEKPTADR